jgi:hypothetical protein
MNKLENYFKKSGTRLGVFYPTHHLIAVFRSPMGAESAMLKMLDGSFAPSDAIAADGEAVLEADEAETDLAGFVMRAISRFFATEQVFADQDLEDARKGAGFLAVRCPTPQAFTKPLWHLGPSGKTWSEACTHSYQTRSAAH